MRVHDLLHRLALVHENVCLAVPHVVRVHVIDVCVVAEEPVVTLAHICDVVARVNDANVDNHSEQVVQERTR